MKNMTKRRRALLSFSKKKSRLPDGLVEVKWLQCTGGQYCVTDIYPVSSGQNTFTAIRGDITLLDRDTSAFKIGCGWNESGTTMKYEASYSQGTFRYYYGPSTGATRSFAIGGVYPRDVHYEINIDNVYGLDAPYSTFQYQYNATSPIAISNGWTSNNIQYKPFKIFNVNQPLYEFVPCYRESDGKTGFCKITLADNTMQFFPTTGEEWVIGPVV